VKSCRAPSGSADAVSCTLPLGTTSLWPAIAMLCAGGYTLTAQVAIRPLCAFAVITASPGATAVTTPFATVATPVLLLVHSTPVYLGFDGESAAFSAAVCEVVSASCAADSLMPVTPW